MDDLGKIYAAAKAGTFTLKDEQSVLLEQWRALPVSTVWTRQLNDVYFFKAHEWQYRHFIPYRLCTPEEAVVVSEDAAACFAQHGIKTDPEQILDAMADLVVVRE